MQREPDRVGLRAKGWRSALLGDAHKYPRPESAACLECWLVDYPGVHAFWSQWLVSLCHLRPVADETRPAVKHYPEAEYEIVFGALDPKDEIDIDSGRWTVLTPLDLVYQFHGVSDRDAVRIFESLLHVMIEGGLPPDADFRSTWKRMLDDTVAHFRTGKHPEN